MDILDLILSELGGFAWVILALIITYLTGSFFERRHFASLARRERNTLSLPLITSEKITKAEGNVDTRFVYGSAVIAADYFKITLSGLRLFFGGNVGAYETVIDRGRREALMRMKDEAGGADEVIAVRITTSQVGPGRIEVVAYGTAVYTQSS